MDTFVLDARSIADAQVDFARILDDEGASRIETHRDTLSRPADLLLRLLTEHGAADRAGDRRNGIAAPSPILADDAASIVATLTSRLSDAP